MLLIGLYVTAMSLKFVCARKVGDVGVSV
jgi:hypothetical protein